MGAEPAPPAVAGVVVAHRPGPWFEEVLGSLAGQDYPNFSVVVVGEGDVAELSRRVTARIPSARVVAVPEGTTFGEAANLGVATVDGAQHVLVCRDDMAFAPDAVRALLEEAYRNNAGLTCPKWVMWSSPERLVAVGMGADHLGVSQALVDPGELDQGQHDAVREVFVAPSGAVLVRTDLWRALGGYEVGWGGGGEDLDLSWRAQLAGARVLVAPQAVVRHLDGVARAEMVRAVAPPRDASPPNEAVPQRETAVPLKATGGREGAREAGDVEAGEVGTGAGAGAVAKAGDEAMAEANHLRTAWICYGWAWLLLVVPMAVTLALAEAVWSAAHGRSRRECSAPLAGLSASLSSPRRLWAARRRAQALRRTGDFAIWKSQAHGSARVRALLRSRLEKGHEIAWAASRARLSWRWALPTAAGVVLIALIGSRHVLTQPLPLVGQLPTSTGGVGRWWRHWWSGPGLSGFGAGGLSPPGLFVMGLAGAMSLGSANFAVHVLVLAPLVVGPLGIYLAARRLGSGRGRLAATLLYAAVPVPYDALAQGHWAGLVSFAAAPWVINGLCLLSGQAPYLYRSFESSGPALVRLGLALAVGAALAPSLLPVVMVLGASLFAGSWLVAKGEGATRLLVSAGAAVVAAWTALLPWSLGLLGSWAGWTGASADFSHPLGVAEAARLQSGPFGGGALGWALVLAAAVPLVIGRSWRLAWAGRLWAVALVFMTLAWAASRDWFPSPPLEVLLAPAAAALVLSVALGAASVEIDLAGYRFGWRQFVPPVGAVAAVAALLPWFAWAGNGQWDLPASGAETAFAFPSASTGDYRVLWVGPSGQLPLAPAGTAGPLAFGASADGPALVDQLWSQGGPSAAVLTSQDLRWAQDGQTSQLGHLLALLSVRFVVVPEAVPSPATARLITALARQVDLVQVGLDQGYAVFENSVWLPVFAALPPGPSLHALGTLGALGAAGAGRSAASQLSQLRLSGYTPLPMGQAGSTPQADVAAGGAVFGSVPGSGWRASAEGGAPRRQSVLGATSLWTPATSSGRTAAGMRIEGTGAAGRHGAGIAMLSLWVAALVLARDRRQTGPLARLTMARLDVGGPKDQVLEIDWSSLTDGQNVG